jgi:pantetheine-phosphate adenylyltransferase
VKALFAGSFDPIHCGHIDLITRATALFEEVHVLVADSLDKKYYFSLEERFRMVTESLAFLPSVRVFKNQGLVVDYGKKEGILFLLRGLRTSSDLEYEQSLEWYNNSLAPEIKTWYLMTRPEFRFLSSRSLRELKDHPDQIQHWIPEPVYQAFLRCKSHPKSLSRD